jgi:hypothetical protein
MSVLLLLLLHRIGKKTNESKRDVAQPQTHLDVAAML